MDDFTKLLEEYTNLEKFLFKLSLEDETALSGDDTKSESEKEVEFSYEETQQEALDIEVQKEDEAVPELKQLPDHLRYEFLDSTKKDPVIMASELTDEHRKLLLAFLRNRK